MSRRLAMFGGTFNPPHIGHVHAARAAAQAMGLSVLWIPDNIPPHKELPAGSASPEERLEMTRLAAEEVPGSFVSDMELRRGERSYTADTLEELRVQYPEDELWLIVGTDMLCTLHRWYCPEKIFRLARIAAIARDEGDLVRIRESAEMLREQYQAEIAVVEAEPVPISSSEIRAGLYHGTEKWLPERVFAYIRERGLYL